MTSTNDSGGMNPSHIWERWVQYGLTGPYTWWVVGRGQFTTSGRAVVNDFGTLVPVPFLSTQE